MVFAVFVRAAFSLLIASPVLCLAQSTPTEVWAQRYAGPPSSGQDKSYRILRDNKGDIIVFGTTLDRNGSSDFVTIKYSGTDGSMLWSRRYDSPNKLDEHTGGLALDAVGNVFITGSSGQTGTEWDMYTAKYAGDDGHLFWERTYTGPGNFDDHAVSIAIDSAGNAVIAGHSREDNHTDLYLAKYANTNGSLIWDRRHTNGTPRGTFFPNAMLLNPAGDIFVTGSSELEMHTGKYSGADGRLLWEIRRGVGEHDKGLSLVADAAGDLIVAGHSFNFSSLYDIYVAKYRAFDGMLLWERQYNGSENGDDIPSCLAVDQGGNIFLGGSSHTNLFVAKYSGNNGTTLWEQRVPGKANFGLQVNSLAVNQNSDLIVAATVENAFTAKYSSATGAVIWEKRSAPGSSIFSTALVLASNGDAFVTGSADGDFYTVRYASSDGAPLWEKTYNEPAKGVDIPRATAIDAEGNVVVFGSSNQDLYTAKYDAKGGGRLLWERRYIRTAAVFDDSASMILDAAGNVIISGKARFETNGYVLPVYLAKYAASNGAILWERYVASSAPISATISGLELDQTGNVIITGSTDDAFRGEDIYTAKFSATDGTLLWERSYTSAGRNYDQANALALDPAGGVIITGSLQYGLGNDAYSAKYAAADGAILWEQRLPNNARFRTLQTDRSGNAIAIGTRNRQQHLAKFDANTGALLWERMDTNGVVSRGPFLKVDSKGSIFTSAFMTVIPTPQISFSVTIIQKYSSDGALLWEQQYRRDSHERPSLTLMTLDSMENLLLVGALHNEFGIAKDTFMVRFAMADGALLWELNKADYVASAVAFDSKGALAVTGSTDVDFVTLLFQEDLPILRATRNAGGALQLSWPAAFSQWRLESQSNPLGLRPGSPWAPVAIAPLTNSITLPLDLNAKASFFRITRP